VARQTFKELTPIQQMEYLGGEIFIGNPRLQMSAVKNYDLRLDYTPLDGGLISAAIFHKDIKSPIEYVQGLADFTYTTAANYPKGELTGLEFEVRQRMDQLWKPLKGLTLGANATFIQSQVTLPADQAAKFARIHAPMPTRDMTNTPNHLFNIFATYDLEATGTQLGAFYTIKGDALSAGAVAGSVLIPSLYEKQYDTLNFSIFQKLGKNVQLRFLAKNLTNPQIERVYRSQYIGADKVKSSFRQGIEFVIGINVEFAF
jgi:outer membrane receptor protein involved in Fe transport